MPQLMSSLYHFLYLASIVGQLVQGLPADGPMKTPSGQLPAITAGCTSPPGSSKTCGIFVGQTGATVVATTSGKSTWSETYIATTFPAYSTLKTATTVTTTDTAGETIVAVILAGGAGLLSIPKPVPPEAPGPPITTVPTPSLPSSKPVSTSSSTFNLTPQREMISLPDPDWPKIFSTPHVVYSRNDISCGWPDNTPAVSRDEVSSKIKTFCTAKNGTVVNQTTSTGELYNVGSGVVLNITVDQYPLCAKRSAIESTILFDDCNYFFHEALDGCDTKTLAKRGGNVRDSCFIWNLKPQDNHGELTCGAKVNDGTGINRDEAMANIKNFCSGFALSSLDSNKKIDKIYKPRLGNSNMHLSAHYSDDAECKKDGSSPYIVESASCERFLRRAIDDCDTDFKGYLGKYGGSITDGCGVYSLSTEVVEYIICGNNQYPKPHDMTPDAMKKGIDDYCGRSLTLDPNYKYDNQFHQDTPKGASDDNVISGDVVVRFHTEFNGQNQKDCAQSRAFDTKGDECRRRMEAVQSKCGNQGGGLSANTQDGCTIWTMWGSSTG